jgi:peroxiredoxin
VRPLLIGSAAPAAQLLDAEGQSFDLGEAFAAGPAILVFYRAHW